MFLLCVGQVSCGSSKGCAFEVPPHVRFNPEPRGTPLYLNIDIHVIGLREVADSGGSFGIDVEYVPIYSVNHGCFS